jgi:signal transduction histidine kinase
VGDPVHLVAAVELADRPALADVVSLDALAERRWLGRELHDSVSQELYGIVLAARTGRALLPRDPGLAAEALEQVLALAEVALAELRGLIVQLRPEAVTAAGLVAALAGHAATVAAVHGVAVETDLVEPAIAPEAREAAYWIAREALHNAVKHGGPGRVVIRLVTGAEACLLEVADDGTGFDPGLAWRRGGIGLQTMGERAAAAGAALEVASAAGAGTTVRLRLPLAPA